MFSNATQVEDSESPDLMNMVFSGIGSTRKRQGFVKFTTALVSSGNRIQGLYSYITSAVNQVLYISNGVLYRYNAGNSTTITGGTFSTTADINAAQIGDKLFFYDGVTALSYYNGTAVSTTGVASAPIPKQGIAYNKRQYVNAIANIDRVYYSKPLTVAGASTDVGSFDSGATNAGFFGFGDGHEVIGFARQSTYLYVFCKSGIFRVEPVVSGATITDHSAVPITSSIGCRAPRSIENVGNDVYFLDSTIYSLGEIANFVTLRTTNISAKVSNLFSGMSQEDISKAAAIYSTEQEVYLLALKVGSSAYNDRVIGYSLPYKSWFLWDSLKVNSWLEFIDDTDVKHLYFGSDDSATSYVYEAYQGTNDDSAAINSYYYTKVFDSKYFDTEKIYQMWSVQFGGVYGVVTIDFLVEGVVVDTVILTSGSSISFASGWGSLPMGTFAWGLDFSSPIVSATDPGLNNDWRRHDLDGLEGTTFQFKFSNAEVGQSFELKQATVRYIDFSDKPYKVLATREV